MLQQMQSNQTRPTTDRETKPETEPETEAFADTEVHHQLSNAICRNDENKHGEDDDDDAGDDDAGDHV